MGPGDPKSRKDNFPRDAYGHCARRVLTDSLLLGFLLDPAKKENHRSKTSMYILKPTELSH